MDFNILTKDNFILYAMGQYTNPDCRGMNEFVEDMAKIKYVKRLLKKYNRGGCPRPILLMNHLLILGNVFGNTATTRMLFYKLEPELYAPLKTVLLYLNYIVDESVVDGLHLGDIMLDQRLASILRKTTNDSTQN